MIKHVVLILSCLKNIQTIKDSTIYVKKIKENGKEFQAKQKYPDSTYIEAILCSIQYNNKGLL